MHSFQQFLGIMLTLFMLGSSSGMAYLPAGEPEESTADGTSVSVIQDEGDQQDQPNDKSGDTGGAMLPSEPNPDLDGEAPVQEPEVTEVPTEASNEANPSTGPPVEEPVIEEPMIEEPVVEAPVVEEPVVEAPVVDDPVVEAPVVEEPVVEAPVVEEPVVEAPVVEEPVVEEPAVEDEVVEDSNTPEIVVDSNNTITPVSEATEVAQPANTNLATNIPYTINVENWDDVPLDGALVIVTDYEGDVEYGNGTTVGGVITFQLAPGEYYVTVSKAGYFTEEFVGFTIWEGDTSGSTDIHLNAKVDGTFTITVLNWDTDAPVAGATVAITDINNVSLTSGQTNASGVYTSSIPLPAGSIYFTVSHPSYYSDSASGWIEGNTVHPYPFYISPITGGTITFSAYDATGNNETPLANVAVHLESWDDGTEYNGTTTSDGKVTFTNLPGGEYSVTATLAGYQVREQKLEVHGDATENLPMFQIDENPGAITINTFDQNSQPLSGVLVVIVDDNGAEVDRGTTANGVFTSRQLPFGVYDATATKAGFHEYERINITVNRDTSVDMYMDPVISGTASIEILDVETDAPISGATVTVAHESLTQNLVLTTNAQGIVTFQATSLGAYDIEVTKAGYTTNGRLYTYAGPDATTIYIRELRPGIATIVVRDMDTNALLAGVGVEVIGGPENEVVFTGTTDANGKVTTGILPEASYTVNLTKDGYFSISTVFGVEGNVQPTFYMETEKTGVMTVQVLDTVDVPVSGATVFVYEAIADGIVSVDGGISVRYIPGTLIISATTGSNGRISTPVLESGSYLVFVEAPGFETYSRVVHMNGDQTTSFNLVAGTSTPVDPTNPGEPTETPTPSETPVPTVPTTPGEDDDQGTPGEGDDDDQQNPGGQDGDDGTNGPDDGEPGSDQTGTLTLGFSLCVTAGCESGDTQYDGYTVMWTVTPLQTAATEKLNTAQIASVNTIGQPITFAAMQQAQGFTVTGVIQNGSATGTTDQILVGTYAVCLNPVITGPNGETATIANGEVCSNIDVTSGGTMQVPFSGVAGSVAPGGSIVVPDNGSTTPQPEAPVIEQPVDPNRPDVAQNSGGTDPSGISDTSVTDLPNTGAGPQSPAGDGLMITSVLILVLATVVFGSKRTSRA